VALAALAGCSGVVDPERRTATEEFTVDGASVDSVVVRGGDGETVVEGTDDPDVCVEATKYAIGGTDLSEVAVTREPTGGRLEVGARLTEGMQVGVVGGGLETLDVRVPDGVRVERVETDDGSVEVREVAGDLALDVDDDTATVDGVAGAVGVTCDDGEVTVGAVDRVAGEFDDASFRMTEGATVDDLAADDGDLELAIAGLDGDVTVETDDGDVEAALSSALDATVEVHTDDGSVRAEDGALDSVELSGETTRGTVGAGTGRLVIRVDDGSVRLDPLASDQ